MRGILFFLGAFLFLSCGSRPKKMVQTNSIQLSNPVIEIDSLLFYQSAEISATHPMKGAIVRFAIQGEKLNQNSLVFEASRPWSTDVDLLFQAFHPDFLPSEVVGVSTRRMSAQKFQILKNSTSARSPYNEQELTALQDGQKGLINHLANRNWLGYNEEVLTYEVGFEIPTECEKVILSMLSNNPSWIFSPRRIEVWEGEELLGFLDIEPKEIAELPRLYFWETSFEKRSLERLNIKVINHSEIPDWHIGKGTPPWAFIDEIIIK